MQLRSLLTAMSLAAVVTSQAQNTSPYWSLAGNSNASNTTSKLGTTNAINLRLYTNNVERVRILSSNGYVGVGTTAPTERLHINGPAGSNVFRAQVNGSTKLLIHSGGGMAVGANVVPPTNGLYVSGNVGIGTNVPEGKLHIKGSTTASSGLVVSGFNNGIITSSNSTNGMGITTTADQGWGVYATSNNIGVYSNAANYGVYAHGSGESGRGVFGSGTLFGVQGDGGVYGVYGYGKEYGIYGHSDGESSRGVIGISSAIGVQGNGDIYGIYGVGQEYAGFFEGNLYSTGSFQPSARKLKENIIALNSAMTILNKLQPKEYEYKQDGKYKSMNLPKGKRYGLIAEELEEILPDLVKETSFDNRIAQKPDSTRRKPEAVTEKIDFKAVNYTELIPIMIKGMQEQEEAIQGKDKRITDLETDVAELRQMLLELKSGRTGIVSSLSGNLEQNTPNPATGTTIIRYHVPQTSSSAKLNITNAKGQVIKIININNKGTGHINLNTTGLAAGTYNYTLYVDGRQANTKRLIITK